MIASWLEIEDLVRFSYVSHTTQKWCRGWADSYRGNLTYAQWLALRPSTVTGVVSVYSMREGVQVHQEVSGPLLLQVTCFKRSNLVPVLRILQKRAAVYPESHAIIRGCSNVLWYRGSKAFGAHIKHRIKPQVPRKLRSLHEVEETEDIAPDLDVILSSLVRGRTDLCLDFYPEAPRVVMSEILSLLPQTLDVIRSQPLKHMGLSVFGFDSILLPIANTDFPGTLKSIYLYNDGIERLYQGISGTFGKTDIPDTRNPRSPIVTSSSSILPWNPVREAVRRPPWNSLFSKVRELRDMYIPLILFTILYPLFPNVQSFDLIVNDNHTPKRPIEITNSDTSYHSLEWENAKDIARNKGFAVRLFR